MPVITSHMITDYANPSNRVFKVPIDGVVKGYTFKQMSRWVEKWDDPLATIRSSWRYAQLYKEHYRHLMEYLPKKCITKLKAEKRKKTDELNRQRAKYLVDGLSQCIDMFEKIQNQMEPTDEYYKSFVYETKVLFFSFYDLCSAKPEK